MSDEIKFFAYGTLKQGYANHHKYCQDVINITPAKIYGRLYHLREGYPAIEIPSKSIIKKGTKPSNENTINPSQYTESKIHQPIGDWNEIEGELIVLRNAAKSLALLDRLEGFCAGQPSLYQRSLVLVNNESHTEAAWVYHMNSPSGVRIKSGRWQSAKSKRLLL